ncbi:hypothetical protein [Collimonas sp. OK607]|uniref:hypothetical protein n=1 Tax=Collimonas sp. OK607 TaxID=1798194 RepID=UPI001113B765|nr:hypothetical protein [Collimonas sp. OK607]
MPRLLADFWRCCANVGLGLCVSCRAALLWGLFASVICLAVLFRRRGSFCMIWRVFSWGAWVLVFWSLVAVAGNLRVVVSGVMLGRFVFRVWFLAPCRWLQERFGGALGRLSFALAIFRFVFVTRAVLGCICLRFLSVAVFGLWVDVGSVVLLGVAGFSVLLTLYVVAGETGLLRRVSLSFGPFFLCAGGELLVAFACFSFLC